MKRNFNPVFLIIFFINLSACSPYVRVPEVEFSSKQQQGIFFKQITGRRPFQQYLTAYDKKQIDYGLNYTPTERTHIWYNQQTQTNFQLIPEERYYLVSDKINELPCRNFELKLLVNRSSKKSYHIKACKQRDLNWVFQK